MAEIAENLIELQYALLNFGDLGLSFNNKRLLELKLGLRWTGRLLDLGLQLLLCLFWRVRIYERCFTLSAL